MILTELVINNIGPFAEPTKINFEENITVLTGANDSGKSSILNAIELLYGMKANKKHLNETDVNLDRIGNCESTWESDEKITCEGTFIVTDVSGEHVRNLPANSEIKFICVLAPNCRRIGAIYFRKTIGNGGWSQGGSVSIESFPQIIRLPMKSRIRSVIDLNEPNDTELEFLRSAFGPQFNYQKYSNLSDGAYYSNLSKAKGDVNSKLRRFLPPSMTMEFDFQNVGGERDKLSIQLRDNHEGHTPLELRGSGIKTLVSLMAALLSTELNDQHHLILLDEPEMSLHADAQHRIRAVLEALSEKKNVQVIYATHSPSMINPFLTNSIRVVSRTNNGSYATSTINSRPIDENFMAVRSSLGLLPSDSLLYGPVTLIVEGPTEVIGLPIILKRLWEKKIAGFELVDKILPQVHFLDGCGDSFDQLCKLAISHGTKPVVFLDGDKAGSRLNKLRSRFPQVPIVLLEGASEFEEIVPMPNYIEALRNVMSEFHDDADKQLTEESFTLWENENQLPQQMAFTKRIDRWVQDTIGLSVEKPRVMKEVLRVVPVEKVKYTKIAELVDRLVSQLT